MALILVSQELYIQIMSEDSACRVSNNLQAQPSINQQFDFTIKSSSQYQGGHETQHLLKKTVIQNSQVTNSIEKQNDNLTFQTGVDSFHSNVNNLELSSQSHQQKETSLKLLQQAHKLQELQKIRLQKQLQLKVLNLQISQQQLKRPFLFQQLNHMNLVYAQKYEQYSEIVQDQTENIEDEIEKIEENIYYLQSQIVKIRKECEQKLEERKRYEASIKIFQQKGEELNILFNNENRTLEDLIGINFLIERQIKNYREEYQKLQEEIYDLDMRNENLKKYGIQIISESMHKLLFKKQDLQNQIKQTRIQIEKQRKIMQNLVPLETITEVNDQILKCKKAKEQIFFFLQQNQELTYQNSKLNQIQWNPNLEIKGVESSLRQQQAKIDQVERDISNIKNQSNEIRSKIDQFERSIKINKASNINKQDCLCKSRQQLNRQSHSRKYNKGKMNKNDQSARSKPTIYQQIKQQIEQQKNTKHFNWYQIFGRWNQQKKLDDPLTIKDTYKVNKKIGRFELWAIIIVVCMVFWVCFKFYTR